MAETVRTHSRLQSSSCLVAWQQSTGRRAACWQNVRSQRRRHERRIDSRCWASNTEPQSRRHVDSGFLPAPLWMAARRLNGSNVWSSRRRGAGRLHSVTKGRFRKAKLRGPLFGNELKKSSVMSRPRAEFAGRPLWSSPSIAHLFTDRRPDSVTHRSRRARHADAIQARPEPSIRCRSLDFRLQKGPCRDPRA